MMMTAIMKMKMSGRTTGRMGSFLPLGFSPTSAVVVASGVVGVVLSVVGVVGVVGVLGVVGVDGVDGVAGENLVGDVGGTRVVLRGVAGVRGGGVGLRVGVGIANTVVRTDVTGGTVGGVACAPAGVGVSVGGAVGLVVPVGVTTTGGVVGGPKTNNFSSTNLHSLTEWE